MSQKKFLFTGGCPRSGTTRITNIIGAHPQVVLGIERYNKLLHKNSFAIKKEHFSKERFLHIEKGDTFYQDFFKFKHHQQIPEKWDGAKYVGVKYTYIDEIFQELKASLSSITVVYIYRNVFDVAESWNRRALSGNNWPADMDYKKAVVKWNQSLRQMHKYLQQKEDIICLNFSDLLFTDKPIINICHRLQIETSAEVERKVRHARKIAQRKKEEKGILSPEQFEYIQSKADIRLYEEFNHYFNILA